MYEDISQHLKDMLKLKNSPVAVALSNDKPDLEMLDGRMRFCEMLGEVIQNNRSFCTVSENHSCDGGACTLGLRAMPESMRSGEFLYKRVGLFGSAMAARRFFNSNLRVEAGTTKFVLFSPLEDAEFTPDVIVIACSAGSGMRAIEASAYDAGIVAKGRMGPVCSTVVAAPYLSGNVIYTLGDAGGRKYAKLNDSDVLIGVPLEKMGPLLHGLEEMIHS